VESRKTTLLTVDEVVERLRIGRTSLNGFLWSGALPSIKLGRRRLVHPDDLDRFVREHQYLPGDEW